MGFWSSIIVHAVFPGKKQIQREILGKEGRKVRKRAKKRKSNIAKSVKAIKEEKVIGS